MGVQLLYYINGLKGLLTRLYVGMGNGVDQTSEKLLRARLESHGRVSAQEWANFAIM